MDERLKDVLFFAGSQWGKAPTPEELISALDAAGYVIVPREPTEKMMSAMNRRNDDNDHEQATLENWKAAIDAALTG